MPQFGVWANQRLERSGEADAAGSLLLSVAGRSAATR